MREVMAAPASARAPLPGAPVVVDLVPAAREDGGADLFRSAAFHRLHAPAFERSWYAIGRDLGTGAFVAGGWFAEVEPGVAVSGARGPYGGFDSPHGALPIAVTERLLLATEDGLRAQGVHRVVVTLPPAAHDPAAHAAWMNAAMRHGYAPAPPDVNYHTVVGDAALADRMNSGNRAIVRTATRKGLQARALAPGEWDVAYDVIAHNRARRGRRLTMRLDALVEMDRAIPGAVHWFGAFLDGAMVAAATCLRVSARACYVFFLGEADGMEKRSPVTLLVSHVHDWCRDLGITLLDLGIATERGLPNEGLMAYKRNLGFDASLKFTLRKDLAP